MDIPDVSSSSSPGIEIVSGPYTMVPQNITFIRPATLAFSIPAGVPVQELVLMEERDGAWSDTTFSIINNTITTSINRPGIFALFAPVHPVITSTAAIPESTYISPTPATTTQPTPTKAGLELSLLAGGLLVLGMTGWKRKQR
jgi:hypothetical protein